MPLAILALETVAWRRNVVISIAFLGAAVSLYLLAIFILFPATAGVVGQHILYDFPNPYEQTTTFLYVVVTCVSLMFSSHRRLVAFGVATFVAEVVAYALYQVWFISVWCFFTAALSVMVLWYFQGRGR